MTDLSAWIGRTEDTIDRLSPSVLARLAATLDHTDPPWPKGEAPPLAHWVHFLPQARQGELACDGHPLKGGFLPPVPLPRRMWAGGRIRFTGALPVGADIARRSTIADIRHKHGASGDLTFVTVGHKVTIGGVTVVNEEQDLVYRGEATGDAKAPAPASPPRAADVIRTVRPEPTLLFRFSALTFNAHRIHYDRDYARDVEGYAGLVVHGPLIAMLLMDHFLRAAPDRRVSHFAFRAQRPLLDTTSFNLCLAWREDGADLWTLDASGAVTMTAQVKAQ